MDNTLEVFGYNGEYHTLDYIDNVNQLDIWEIDKNCEAILRKNLPFATIKITNSFEEIKQTKKSFNTIVIDNHQGLFGDGKCEHFEIIEDCFKKLQNKGVIIANVIPNILLSKYQTSNTLKEEHIERRKKFYTHPKGDIISLEFLKQFYTQLANKNGFKVEHLFFVKRNYLLTYLVLCLTVQSSHLSE